MKVIDHGHKSATFLGSLALDGVESGCLITPRLRAAQCNGCRWNGNYGRHDFPADVSTLFLNDSNEIDLVRSGLEDVMHGAWGRISDISANRPGIRDHRSAAYVVVQEERASAYEAIGF